MNVHKKGTRSLQTLVQIISHPEQFDQMVKLAVESDAWGGALSNMGGHLLHLHGDEKSSVLSTTARFLRFLNSPVIAENTRTSSFNLSAIRKRPTAAYLIVPLQHARADAPLMRLWITSFTKAAIQGKMQERNKIYFEFDEAAAALGGAPLGAVQDAIERLRSWGVRCHFYFQSRGQLARCFKEDGGLTLLSNTAKLFFGVNDPDTGEFLEKSLGQQTIMVRSGSSNRGGSYQSSSSSHGGNSYSRSWNDTASWQPQGRSLIQNAELLKLDPRILIACLPGMPPVRVRMLRWFEEKPAFFKRRGRIGEILRGLRMGLIASFHLVAWAVVALVATLMALEAKQKQEAIQRFRQEIQGLYVPAPMQRPAYR
jgi:type IV secretion system protein VirD4